jgi:hypothetical protein
MGQVDTGLPHSAVYHPLRRAARAAPSDIKLEKKKRRMNKS